MTDTVVDPTDSIAAGTVHTVAPYAPCRCGWLHTSYRAEGRQQRTTVTLAAEHITADWVVHAEIGCRLEPVPDVDEWGREWPGSNRLVAEWSRITGYDRPAGWIPPPLPRPLDARDTVTWLTSDPSTLTLARWGYDDGSSLYRLYTLTGWREYTNTASVVRSDKPFAAVYWQDFAFCAEGFATRKAAQDFLAEEEAMGLLAAVGVYAKADTPVDITPATR